MEMLAWRASLAPISESKMAGLAHHFKYFVEFGEGGCSMVGGPMWMVEGGGSGSVPDGGAENGQRRPGRGGIYDGLVTFVLAAARPGCLQ
jgi:hypothetical protein